MEFQTFSEVSCGGMIRPLMEILNVLLNALLNGILPISIISNQWVTAGYKACIILMISILPAKIAWGAFLCYHDGC